MSHLTQSHIGLLPEVPIVWCVGGSDSSAHAGLQADMRTGQDLGCHVQTIITCITAQNSKEVRLVEPVSVKMFDAQWQTLLEDVPPSAIKVSLLPSIDIVKACAIWLQKIKTDFPHVPIIFDPVMAASSEEGNQLQSSSVGRVLLGYILPHCDIITPNAMEFTALTSASSEQMPDDIAQSLMPYFKVSDCHWLLKGGHSSANSAIDWLIDKASVIGFSSEKMIVSNTRGTGCTLSTALASFMAHGYDLLDAVTMAKTYLNGALKSGIKIGEGSGPLGRPGWPASLVNLPDILPQPFAPGEKIRPFTALDLDQMGLYPVVDSIEWLSLVLDQGVKIAQLRIKDPEDKALNDKIQKAVALGEQHNAQVFINDYWQQAIRFGAYGVHLGQEDLALADLQQIQKAGLRLGISTHGYYEIARAQSIQPSYIALGHIFPTQTKEMPSQPQGLSRLAHYAELLKGHFPTVAIGGINAERLPSVVKTGVNSVAVVTAITQARDPVAATRNLMSDFLKSKRHFDSEGETL